MKVNEAKIFDNIYTTTYKTTLKFFVLRCNKIEDINDLLQDTYLEIFKQIRKKKIQDIEDVQAYIIGIAKNVLRKYYQSKSNIFSSQVEYIEEITLDSDIDVELQFITKDNVEKIWNYVKNKNILIAKIFYCYYYLDMKLNDIAKELQLNESTTKTYLYRTIKELKKVFYEEVDKNEKK